MSAICEAPKIVQRIALVHYYNPEGEYAWTMEQPYSEQDAKQFFGEGRNRPHGFREVVELVEVESHPAARISVD